MECQRISFYGPVELFTALEEVNGEVMINAEKYAHWCRRRVSRKMWSRNSRKFVNDSHLVIHQHVSTRLWLENSFVACRELKLFSTIFPLTFAEIYSQNKNCFPQEAQINFCFFEMQSKWESKRLRTFSFISILLLEIAWTRKFFEFNEFSFPFEIQSDSGSCT